MVLCQAYDLKSQFAQAVAECQRARELNDDPYVLAFLAHALVASSKRDEALKVLGQMNELAKQRYVPAYGFGSGLCRAWRKGSSISMAGTEPSGPSLGHHLSES